MAKIAAKNAKKISKSQQANHVNKPKRVAVIAAHPDDEILGCGATMAKHVQSGDEVHVLILAEGLTSRGTKQNRADFKNELSALAKAAQAANKLLGVHSIQLHNFPDNRMDGVEILEAIKVIESFVQTHQPQIIYTHHCGDVNIDHRQINQAVITACRPIPDNTIERILFFEIASSTEWQPAATLPTFQPNWFVDVSTTIAKKLAALALYESEMRPWPHARSIQALEHLAKWRGATIGVNAAEAFMLGRHIEYHHSQGI